MSAVRTRAYTENALMTSTCTHVTVTLASRTHTAAQNSTSVALILVSTASALTQCWDTHARAMLATQAWIVPQTSTNATPILAQFSVGVLTHGCHTAVSVSKATVVPTVRRVLMSATPAPVCTVHVRTASIRIRARAMLVTPIQSVLQTLMSATPVRASMVSALTS